MGRKAKVGKRRKDKFYHLAKETGYRARSAFKLIQLNRKYSFLQKSRVLVDLCAAPGGWLQVAAKFMPVSSLIIGIDLVPIKSIPNVITLQEDITSARCKQQLQRELKTWKVDCLLNDGAPNVGSAWVQDAFSQAELTLAAVKLATEFLREGGYFITKVFRSKDYQPLMWVLEQLFKKVNATKPQASRLESAEIFVVCQGYLAPSKVDPKLLDPRFVFKDIEDLEGKDQKISLTKIQKPSKAEGYPDDARILYKTTSVADYITGEDYLKILCSTNKLVFDKMSDVFAKHPLTTDEIRTSCEDIKVLGPRDLKQLVKWREKLRKFLEDVDSDEEEPENVAMVDTTDEQIKRLEKEEAAEAKRERRRLRQQRRKLKERLVKNRSVDDEAGEIVRQEHLFQLKAIKSQAQLEEVDKGIEMEEEELVESSGDEPETDMDGTNDEQSCSDQESDVHVDGVCTDVSESECSDDDDDDSASKEESEEEPVPRTNSPDNPLVVSFEDAATARASRADRWFNKTEFAGLNNECDEDIELEQMVEHYQSSVGVVDINQANKEKKTMDPRTETRSEGNDEEVNSSDKYEPEQPVVNTEIDSVHDTDSSSDDDDSSDDDYHISQAKQVYAEQKHKGEQPGGKESNSLEVVPVGSKRKLDPEGLALGALMIQSKKKREELIDSGYNRWTSNDEGLPDWFVEDEAKFCTKQIPISKEMVEQYRAKLKDMNSRPIKKIAEAKARKKKRALRKLDKIRKRAEVITDASDVSTQEKAQQLKQMYKKASMSEKKKEVQYVVAKKKNAAKRMPRPAGVKGHYKVVDPRMKKDMKKKQKNVRSSRGKGKRKHF